MPGQRYQDPKIQTRSDVSRPFYFIRPYVPRFTGARIERKKHSIPIGFCDEISMREAKARKQQILVEAQNTIKAPVRTQLRAVVGNPANELVATARTTGAQLIVVGSRGLGSVQRLMLGSVSESVLLQSECTVMITKR